MKNNLRSLPPRRGLGWLLGLLLVLAGPHAAQAQQYPGTTPNPLGTGTGLNAPTVVRPDTATVRKPSKKERRALAAADSAKRTERLFGWHVTRPQKAGLLALLPGAGQIYNHKYWKLPLVYSMVGGLGYWIIYQQRYYGYFKYVNNLRPIVVSPTQTISVVEQITNSTKQIPNDELRAQLATAYTQNPNAISNSLITSRRYRDLSILLSALGYGLQILDAVVDAHLHDFDVSDNLSLNLRPTLLPQPGQLLPSTGLALSLRVK